MDFSKILSTAGSIPGASKLLGNLAGLGNLDALKAKAAQQLGISATALDEFAKEAQEILADGKITADEIKTKLSALGAAKGIPQQAIDMALKMMQEKAGK